MRLLTGDLTENFLGSMANVFCYNHDIGRLSLPK